MKAHGVYTAVHDGAPTDDEAEGSRLFAEDHDWALEIEGGRHVHRAKQWWRRHCLILVLACTLVAVLLATVATVLLRHDAGSSGAQQLCQQSSSLPPSGWIEVQRYAFALIVDAVHLQAATNASDPTNAVPAYSAALFSVIRPTHCLVVRVAPSVQPPAGLASIAIKRAGDPSGVRVCGAPTRAVGAYVGRTLLEDGFWSTQPLSSASETPCTDVLTLMDGSQASDGLLLLTLPTPLSEGSYELAFEFRIPLGALRDVEPFASGPSGELEVLLSGQLRRSFSYGVFPFVESGAEQRVPVNVTITTPVAITSVTNTPELHRVAVGDHEQVAFEETRGEPANMMAFAVGRLQRFPAAGDGAGPDVSIYAMSGSLTADDVTVPLAAARHAAAFWAKWTGVAVPLPKLDLLVHTGSYEWSSSHSGLLDMDRYRTLWSRASGTASDLLRSVNVICHEVGHIWFAGVVSVSSAEDRFLTEGMTSFVEDKCVQTFAAALGSSELYTLQFAPPFGDARKVHKGVVFTALDMLSGYGNDEAINSDPTAFRSQLNYYKSAAFMHMLEEFMDQRLGQGALHAAIKDFFARSGHRATSTGELMYVIASALSGKPSAALSAWNPEAPDASLSQDDAVRLWHARLMQWMLQPSIPVVRVRWEPPSAARLQQEPLCRVRDSRWSDVNLSACSAQSLDALSWWVPVSFGAIAPDGVGAAAMFKLELQPEEGSGAVAAQLPASSGVWVPKLGSSNGLYLAVVDSNDPAGLDWHRALLATLSQLSLSTTELETFRSSGSLPSAVLQTLSAVASAVDDARIASVLEPSTDGFARLFDLLIAVGSSPLARQTGPSAYALLSPVVHALTDVAVMLSGIQACWEPLRSLVLRALLPAATALWTSITRLADTHHADLSGATQDKFFTYMAAAAVVPWAAKLDATLAADVCKSLPAGVTSFGNFTDPDIVNIILETAVARPLDCPNAPGNLTAILFNDLQQRSSSMNAHQARSLAFVLAGAPDLGFLQGQLLPATAGLSAVGQTSQLRSVDRLALLRRLLIQGPNRRAMLSSAVGGLAIRWQQLKGSPGGSIRGGPSTVLAAVLGEAALYTTPANGSLPMWVEQLPDAHIVQQQHQQWASAFPFLYKALIEWQSE